MTCNQVSALLSAYIDGELSGIEMRFIREHVCYCPECASELQAERHVKSILGGAPMVAAPAGLEDRLIAAVMAEEHRSPFAVVAKFAVAGVLAFVLATAALQFNRRSEGADPTARIDTSRHEAFMDASDPFGGGQMVYTTSYGQ